MLVQPIRALLRVLQQRCRAIFGCGRLLAEKVVRHCTHCRRKTIEQVHPLNSTGGRLPYHSCLLRRRPQIHFLERQVVRSGGKVERKLSQLDNRRWTKGLVIVGGIDIPAQYQLQEIGGATYMFVQWISGDFTIRHQKPEYYVLKKM